MGRLRDLQYILVIYGTLSTCAHIFFVLPWVPQKLPQIYTVMAIIRIGKVAVIAVYICGNIRNA